MKKITETQKLLLILDFVNSYVELFIQTEGDEKVADYIYYMVESEFYLSGYTEEEMEVVRTYYFENQEGIVEEAISNLLDLPLN